MPEENSSIYNSKVNFNVNIKAPIKTRCSIKGPHPYRQFYSEYPDEIKPLTAPIYCPIYNYPSNNRKDNYMWHYSEHASAQEMYDKINSMCNLQDFWDTKSILFANFESFPCPKEEEICNLMPLYPNKSKEYVRCILLSDFLFKTTNEIYKKSGQVPFYGFSFKKYFTINEWKCIALAPTQSSIFSSICKEIHKALSTYYILITISMDHIDPEMVLDGVPYIEVFVSNRSKIEIAEYSNTLTSYKHTGMHQVINNLSTALMAGIYYGREREVNCAVAPSTRVVNSVTDYINEVFPSKYKKDLKRVIEEEHYREDIINIYDNKAKEEYGYSLKDIRRTIAPENLDYKTNIRDGILHMDYSDKQSKEFNTKLREFFESLDYSPETNYCDNPSLSFFNLKF